MQATFLTCLVLALSTALAGKTSFSFPSNLNCNKVAFKAELSLIEK